MEGLGLVRLDPDAQELLHPTSAVPPPPRVDRAGLELVKGICQRQGGVRQCDPIAHAFEDVYVHAPWHDLVGKADGAEHGLPQPFERDVASHTVHRRPHVEQVLPLLVWLGHPVILQPQERSVNVQAAATTLQSLQLSTQSQVISNDIL